MYIVSRRTSKWLAMHSELHTYMYIDKAPLSPVEISTDLPEYARHNTYCSPFISPITLLRDLGFGETISQPVLKYLALTLTQPDKPHDATLRRLHV